MPELLQEDFTAKNAAKLLKAYFESDQEYHNAAERLDVAVKLLDVGSSSTFERIKDFIVK